MLNTKGSTLLLVVIYLAAFLILGTTIYKLMSTRIFSAVYYAKAYEALYTAESGVEDALRSINDNGGIWPGNIINRKFGAGSYSVYVDTSSSVTYKLTSIGNVSTIFPLGSKVYKRITLQLTVLSKQAQQKIFKYVLASTKNSIKASVVIIGDVYVGNLSSLNPPPIYSTQYQTDAMAGGQVNGNMTINNGSLGPKYITGDLNIKGNITITGTVYVGHNITISPNVNITGGMKVIYFDNDLIIGDNATIKNLYLTSNTTVNIKTGKKITMLHSVLYVPNSNTIIDNDATLTGAFIAKSFEIRDGTQITYEDISDFDLPGPQQTEVFEVGSWNEQW